MKKIITLLIKIVVGLGKRSTIIEIICAMLIILFIYTGLNKIIDYNEFKVQLGRSPFVQNMSQFIAVTLPSGELLVALMLAFRRTRLFGLYVSFFLMALFTGYIWIMLRYSYDLPCSCGGVLAKMSWHDHLIFNACFTVLAMCGVILESNRNRCWGRKVATVTQV